METERLYQQDSHLSRWEATVLACEPVIDGYWVVLDRTAFFPEGGGQLSDGGMMGDIPVLETREREGRIVHLTREAVPAGTRVSCALDWPRRLDHMQQHTGEHILSWAFWSLFGVENIGFHMGEELVTIDLSRPVTQEEMDAAEDLANQCIAENRPIRWYTASPEEVAGMTLRKRTDKAVGELRIVEIEAGDVCTCCGTHASHTGEVGLVKLLRQEHTKGGSRVVFLCGRRALLDYRAKNRVVLEAGAALSVKEGDIPEGIRRMKGEIAAQGAALREKGRLLTDLYAKELLAGAPAEGGGRQGRVILSCQPELDGKEAKLLLNRLTEAAGTAAVVIYRTGGREGEDGRVCYLVGRSADSPADCKYLCDLLNGLYNGKGGGKAGFAQGSGRLLPDWQETAEALRRML